jgi:hypothetical protein
MKWSTLVICVAIAVVLAAPVAAQQSLGEVAGSIKLKRPEGESIVIDQNSVGKARSQPRDTETDLLRDVVGDCLTESSALYDLMVETRDGESFYRDPWRDRVEEVGSRLDGALDELDLVVVEGRYQEAYNLAGRGADQAREALVIIRRAIAGNQPVYSEARTLSREAADRFKDAESALGAASRANAAEDAAPLINPIEADRVMTAFCRGKYAEDSSDFESCIAEQRAAIDAMAGRSAPSVGIDAASFNLIRNNCRFEWPNNFVTQDSCEQRRIAAKKTRQ